MNFNLIKLNTMYDALLVERDTLAAKLKEYESCVEGQPKIISRKQFATVMAERDTLAAKLKDYESRPNDVEGVKREYEAKIAAMTAKHAGDIETYKEIAIASTKSAERKAQTILANSGISVDDLPRVGEHTEKNLTSKELMSQWFHEHNQ